MRKLLFLIIFPLIASPMAEAQEDSVAVDNYRTGVSLYFDYGKLTSLLSKQNTKWEGGASFFFAKHWKIAGEFGTAVLNPDQAIEDGTYESSGNYYRAGLDYIMSIDNKSNLGVGFRYGASSFEDSGYNPADTLNPTFQRTDLSADWYEIIVESEAEFWTGIFLGIKFRLRILNSYTQFPENDVFSIPGYGRTFDNSIPALNLFIKYKIGF